MWSIDYIIIILVATKAAVFIFEIVWGIDYVSVKIENLLLKYSNIILMFFISLLMISVILVSRFLLFSYQIGWEAITPIDLTPMEAFIILIQSMSYTVIMSILLVVLLAVTAYSIQKEKMYRYTALLAGLTYSAILLRLMNSSLIS